MVAELFKLTIDGVVIARGLTLEFVPIFVKAIFETYHADTELSVIVSRDEGDSE